MGRNAPGAAAPFQAGTSARAGRPEHSRRGVVPGRRRQGAEARQSYDTSFAVLLVDRGRNPVEGLWTPVLRAVAAAKRDVDAVGWFEQGEVLGLLLPDVPGAGAFEVTRRLRRELRRRLGEAGLAALSARLYTHGGQSSFEGETPAPVDLLIEASLQQRERRWRGAAKRGLDVLGSLALLVLFAPVMLCVAAAVNQPRNAQHDGCEEDQEREAAEDIEAALGRGAPPGVRAAGGTPQSAGGGHRRSRPRSSTGGRLGIEAGRQGGQARLHRAAVELRAAGGAALRTPPQRARDGGPAPRPVRSRTTASTCSSLGGRHRPRRPGVQRPSDGSLPRSTGGAGEGGVVTIGAPPLPDDGVPGRRLRRGCSGRPARASRPRLEGGRGAGGRVCPSVAAAQSEWAWQ